MPRPRAHNPLHSAVDGLVGAMNGLLDALGAAGPQLPVELQHAPSVVPSRKAGVSAPKQRGPGKGNPRLKNALKKSWAAYTPKERAERVRKLLAGRGLKPKAAAKQVASVKPKKAKPAARRAPAKPKARKSPWASMTAEQRAERMAKMRAGRGKRASAAEPRQATLLEG